MNLTDMVMLLVFLVVFVIVPAVFIQLGSRRKHASHASLLQCPSCGAENYKTKHHCYCCGYDLSASQPEIASEAVLQRVKRADESRAKSPTAAPSPQTVKD
jgi:ribosomal protein L37E